MTINKFLNEQLTQAVDVQKNMVNFITQNSIQAVRAVQEQQLNQINQSIDSAVSKGQLSAEMAEKMKSWYAGVIELNSELTRLQHEHLVKNIEEFSNSSKDKPFNLLGNFNEYWLAATNSSAAAYSENVRVAQELFHQGMSAFKQNTKPVVDAAIDVLKVPKIKNDKTKIEKSKGK